MPATPDAARTWDARAIHHLMAQAANGGVHLLLTSRQQPAGLAGEAVFPAPQRLLPGLATGPGAALFLHHSTKAKSDGAAQRALAREVARVTEGHPLGCTGAKLTVQIIHEMLRERHRYGLVTMCIGGDMGVAGVFEALRH